MDMRKETRLTCAAMLLWLTWTAQALAATIAVPGAPGGAPRPGEGAAPWTPYAEKTDRSLAEVKDAQGRQSQRIEDHEARLRAIENVLKAQAGAAMQKK